MPKHYLDICIGPNVRGKLELIIRGPHGASTFTLPQAIELARALEQAITTLLSEKFCEECEQSFVNTRANAIFCSDACRMRAYRTRKHEKTVGLYSNRV